VLIMGNDADCTPELNAATKITIALVRRLAVSA
jgi:hypothetical protein